jgi:SAM-dependent methyltransferase
LKLPSNSFDLVASSFVIQILDDSAAGVAEAYRVLTPGGRFAFTSDSSGPSNAAYASTLSRRLNALFEEFTAYLPPNGGMGKPVDAAGLLGEAGFVDIREDQASVEVEFEDNAMLWRWAMSHGYRAFIEDLPEDRRREFHHRVLEFPSGDRVLRRTTGVWSGRKPARNT